MGARVDRERVAWRCTACGNDRKGVFARGQKPFAKAFFYLSRPCLRLRVVPAGDDRPTGRPDAWLALRKFLNGFWKGWLDTMLGGQAQTIMDTI